MKLPNADLAVVDPRKVRDYLLSAEHPVGRFKAAFFEGLGFAASNWRDLLVELQRMAATGEAMMLGQTQHGQKYAVRSRIPGRSGRVAIVVSIWIVLHGDTLPRFVTAYQERSR